MPVTEFPGEPHRRFAERLPAKLDAIRRSLLRIDSDAFRFADALGLYRLVCGLTEWADTAGASAVGDEARALEARLAVLLAAAPAMTAEEWAGLTAALERLEELAVVRRGNAMPDWQRLPCRSEGVSPLVYCVDGAAEWLCQALESRGYRVRGFVDLPAFRAALAEGERPAAAVVDMTLAEQWGADGAGALPVIFTSERGDLPARLAAHRAGGSAYFPKPLDIQRLVKALDRLTFRLPEQPYRVLVVDDEPVTVEIQAEILRQAGMLVRTVGHPLKALDAVRDFQPDVLILDVYMPDAGGPELAAVLREMDDYVHLPILFVSAEADMGKQLLALDRGGDDFLVKPVQPEHLVAAVAARAWRARQNDELTAHLRQRLYEQEREHGVLNRHAIVSVSDPSGRIVYVNDKFCEISGYSRRELLGKNHRLVKSGQHSREFYRILWGTIASGRIWQGEICNRRRDGGLYWVESTIAPFLDEGGNPYQYVSIRTDITKLKLSQEALRISDERLRRSHRYAQMGTWDWDLRTGQLYCSESGAPLFGYPYGELETTFARFLDAVHPEDRRRVVEAIDAGVERDAPYEIEHRVVWPDGTVRWLLERGGVVRGADGEPQHILSVVQDIHDRKMAEAALADSETRLKSAQAAARLGNWSWDARSGGLIWSDQVYRIFGLEPGAVEPTCGLFFSFVHPEDAAELKSVERSARRANACHSIDHRIVLAGGEIRWVHQEARGCFDEGGRLLGIEGTVQDITERKGWERNLMVAKEAAERANRAKSDFLSNMSHELRTPLNAVLGFAQILEVDSRLDAEQVDYVQEILRAGRHLLELINEVLDLARIESGRVELSLETVDSGELVRECLALIQPLAAAAGISSHLDPGPGVAVRADRVRLKQVLLNLLSNAVKYNRKHGSIRVSVLPVGAERVRLAVLDTGRGIPAERLNELFEPFSRLGAERSGIEGTGIGLAISRRLVEMMGGGIGVETDRGAGCTFWLELPRGVPASPRPAVPIPEPAGTGNATGRRVLYIEDNPANLKLVGRILNRRPGVHLMTAHTGELGVGLAASCRPDLILVDINLPDMDGYRVLETLKADPRVGAVPIIAVTANAMPNDVERGRRAGFTDYLTKPFDVAHVLTTVDRWLLREAASR
jgi:PAS domain S-box-containing protein